MNKQDILSKPASELTHEELEELLKSKKKKREREELKRREAYTQEREVLIKSLSSQARQLNDQLADFKGKAFDQLSTFYNKMKEYGEIPEDNKGNFTIKTHDGSVKIEFTNHIIREFDERAEAAAAHLEEFLKEEFVKKRNQDGYDMIKSITKKGKDGKFDVNLISRLEQIRNRFDHPEWIKALDLFKEAYAEYGSSQYVRFYMRNGSSQQYEQIPLNFARV